MSIVGAVRRFWLVWLLAVIWVGRGFAAADDATILATIQSRYQKIKALQADFSQTVSSPRIEPVESRGKVMLKSPGRMRWEYASPERKLVVSDGSQYWIEDLTDGHIQPLAIDVDRNVLGILTGQGDLRRHFQIVDRKIAEHHETLTLEPIGEFAGVRRLRLIIDLKRELIVAITVEDLSENTNRINFSNFEVDAKLEDRLFKAPRAQR